VDYHQGTGELRTVPVRVEAGKVKIPPDELEILQLLGSDLPILDSNGDAPVEVAGARGQQVPVGLPCLGGAAHSGRAQLKVLTANAPAAVCADVGLP
jgi:hypothetical protein